jgi:hypothetical protein
MSEHERKITIEQLQGGLDQIKAALKQTKDTESKILDLIAREGLTEEESRHLVQELFKASSYVVQLKQSREELLKLREQYFRGGDDAE